MRVVLAPNDDVPTVGDHNALWTFESNAHDIDLILFLALSAFATQESSIYVHRIVEKRLLLFTMHSSD